ncbi:MAG: M48 family metalloprotease [Candidatus Methanomethylophilaceae archaeon]|jgi:heat shock protein HtpX
MKATWHFRTALTFAILTLVFAAVGWAVGWMFGSPLMGLVALVAAAVLILSLSAIFSKSRALSSNNAKIVTGQEEPRLFRIVRSVADKAGVPMPEIGVTEDYMPNAFATGRSPKDAAVVATRGLLNMLPDDELEGVIAHEISHVKNRDILAMSVASAVSSVIAFVGRFGIYFALAGSGNDKNGGAKILVAILMYISLPVAALILQMSISRKREYLADESAAEITGNPVALANALVRIEKGCDSPANNYNNPAYSPVWISNPSGTRRSLTERIFSTHPSTKDRVERLMKLAERYGASRGPEVYDNSADGTSDPFFRK